MDRRTFIGILPLCTISPTFEAYAQPTRRVWRVGYLGNTPLVDADVERNWGAFRQELQQRGYVEGKNLTFELRFAEESPSATRRWLAS